ncbi:MAG: TPM domain-containing protein, partial [Bacteroidota bacterium]
MRPTYLILSFFLFFFPFHLSAQDFVLDEGDYLSDEEEAYLEKMLRNYQDTTTTEIAIRTIPALEGEALEPYANRLFRELGLGQKDKDNGILILVSRQERKIRIETGYGVEDRVTDLAATYIIDSIIAPRLRNQENFLAFRYASKEIFRLLGGKFQGLDRALWLQKENESYAARKKSYVDSLSQKGDFFRDLGQVFKARQRQSMNQQLEKYQAQTGNYIWIITSSEGQSIDFQEDIFEQLKAQYPRGKNYTILFLENSQEKGTNCYNCLVNAIDADMYVDWPGPLPLIPS